MSWCREKPPTVWKSVRVANECSGSRDAQPLGPIKAAAGGNMKCGLRGKLPSRFGQQLWSARSLRLVYRVTIVAAALSQRLSWAVPVVQVHCGGLGGTKGCLRLRRDPSWWRLAGIWRWLVPQRARLVNLAGLPRAVGGTGLQPYRGTEIRPVHRPVRKRDAGAKHSRDVSVLASPSTHRTRARSRCEL